MGCSARLPRGESAEEADPEVCPGRCGCKARNAGERSPGTEHGKSGEIAFTIWLGRDEPGTSCKSEAVRVAERGTLRQLAEPDRGRTSTRGFRGARLDCRRERDCPRQCSPDCATE